MTAMARYAKIAALFDKQAGAFDFLKAVGRPLAAGGRSLLGLGRAAAPEARAVGSQYAPAAASLGAGTVNAARTMAPTHSQAVLGRAKSIANAGYGNTWKPTAGMYARHPLATLGGAAGGAIGGSMAAAGGDPNSNWYDPSRLLAAGAGAAGGGVAGGYVGRVTRLLPPGLRSTVGNAVVGGGIGATADVMAGNQPGMGAAIGAGVGGMLGPRWMRQLPGVRSAGRALNGLNRGLIGNTGPLDLATLPGEVADVARAARGAGAYANATGAQRLFGVGVGGKARRIGQAATVAGAGALGVHAGGEWIKGKSMEGARQGIEAGVQTVAAQFGIPPDQVAQVAANLPGLLPKFQQALAVMENPAGYLQQQVANMPDEQKTQLLSSLTGVEPQKLQSALQALGSGDGGIAGQVGQFFNRFTDPLLSFFGLDASRMTTIQKLVTVLGGVSMIGGLLGGSTTLGVGGGLALAATLIPHFMGSNLWGGNSQPGPQQQPAATPQLPPAPAGNPRPWSQPDQPFAPGDGPETAFGPSSM